MTTTAVAQGNNFLLPNATFFVELVLFVIVLVIFYRYIVPPLSKSMRDREEMVRKTARDREDTTRQIQQAEERYRFALSDARVEAARIRDEARAEAQGIRDEMKQKADQEVARLRETGERDLAAQRDETMRQLRGDVGGLSTGLAERIVGRSLPGEVQQRSTVDRFLAELDERSGTSAATTHPSTGAGGNG